MGEEESGAAIRRLFNTGDCKDAGLWSQDNQEGAQQCQQGLDKENQEIQGQTDKTGLSTGFERGEEESPSNHQAGFWCVWNFWGQIMSTCSSTKSSSKPPLTKIHREAPASSVQYLKQDFNLVLFTDECGQHWMALMDGHVDGLHMIEQHQLSSNDSKVEMVWWSGLAS